MRFSFNFLLSTILLNLLAFISNNWTIENSFSVKLLCSTYSTNLRSGLFPALSTRSWEHLYPLVSFKLIRFPSWSSRLLILGTYQGLLVECLITDPSLRNWWKWLTNSTVIGCSSTHLICLKFKVWGHWHRKFYYLPHWSVVTDDAWYLDFLDQWLLCE